MSKYIFLFFLSTVLSITPFINKFTSVIEKSYYCTNPTNSFFIKTLDNNVFLSSNNGQDLKSIIDIIKESEDSRFKSNPFFFNVHFKNSIEITNVFQHPSERNKFVFTSKQMGVYITSDCGKTFSVNTVEKHIIDIIYHPFNQNTLLGIYLNCQEGNCVKNVVFTNNQFSTCSHILENVVQIDW